MTAILAAVTGILFLASFVRSTFGFGDALVAMPLLAFVIEIEMAAPLVAIFSTVISVSIILSDKEKIELKPIIGLIIFSLIGIPLGVVFLTEAADVYVKLFLAIILIGFSVYNLAKPGLPGLKNDKLAPVFGLISGLLGGAYNTNGPPIIIYGALRGWSADKFRAILQGIFLPVNLMIIISHAVKGNYTSAVFEYALWAAIPVALAIFLGTRLNRLIPAEKFRKYIFIALIIIAGILIFRTVM